MDPFATKIQCKQWLKNKNINPKTGRKIKTDGPTYKKLEKACSEYKFKPKPKAKIINNWTYTGYLGSGSTSHVFKGKLNNQSVALKWIRSNEGKKEYNTINKLSECRDSNLLLPYVMYVGNITLHDITSLNPMGLKNLIKRLNLSIEGPQVTRNGTIKGSKETYVMIYPLMSGSLDGFKQIINLNVLHADLTMAFKCLQVVNLIHDDVALRNIFYLKIGDSINYYLGDFGLMVAGKYTNIDIKYEIDKITNKMK